MENLSVVLSTTTAGRLQFFEKTMRSLVRHVEDIDLITKFLHFDDGSDEEDRRSMEVLTSHLFSNVEVERQWGLSFSHERHHASIMQQLFEAIQKFDYWFHCEDDWEFLLNGPIIGDSISLLERFPEIGQVGVWRHPMAQEILKSDGVRFWIFPHDPARRFDHSWKPEDEIDPAWPHFSLRPAITRVDALMRVGNFRRIENFEYWYAKHWTEAGFKTAYLDAKYCRHLGTKWDESAYYLNGTAR